MALFLHHRKFKTRRTAFRRDFCVNCDDLTYSLLTRSWSFLVVFFFIPLFPLGTRTRWLCARCGKRPDKQDNVGLTAKIITLVFAALALWGSTLEPAADSDARLEMGIRIGLAVLIVGSLVAIARHRSPERSDPATVRTMLVKLPPLADCPFCSRPLQLSAGVKRCGSCKLDHVAEIPG